MLRHNDPTSQQPRRLSRVRVLGPHRPPKLARRDPTPDIGHRNSERKATGDRKPFLLFAPVRANLNSPVFHQFPSLGSPACHVRQVVHSKHLNSDNRAAALDWRGTIGLAPEAFRGQFEHRQFGAGSQRSKENTEQSQFLATHGESMGYSCFRCRGTPGSTRRDGSLHRVTSQLRLSAGDRRNGHRAMTTIEGRGTTERQNYQTNPI